MAGGLLWVSCEPPPGPIIKEPRFVSADEKIPQELL
jgi:hypothetical protein